MKRSLVTLTSAVSVLLFAVKPDWNTLNTRLFVFRWSADSQPTSILDPQQGPRGSMEVCLTSPHVFCGSGKGIRPRPSGSSVGGSLGLWSVELPYSSCLLPVWPKSDLKNGWMDGQKRFLFLPLANPSKKFLFWSAVLCLRLSPQTHRNILSMNSLHVN